MGGRESKEWKTSTVLYAYVVLRLDVSRYDLVSARIMQRTWPLFNP